MTETLKGKKIGLALGGGAVLGAAHVGVLKALAERNIEISFISGTSIGAFVGAFFAFGKNPDEIEEIAKDLNWIDIAALSLSRFGLLSNDKMGALLDKHLGHVNIEESHIPITMVAADSSNGQKVKLTSGSVSNAVRASTCIPGIFHPIEIEDKLLVDGGIVENVPINTVKEMGAEFIIGVDLNAKHTFEKPKNIIDVILNSFHFTLQKITTLQTDQADLLIKPNLATFNWTNMSQVKQLMDQGYEDTIKALDQLDLN